VFTNDVEGEKSKNKISPKNDPGFILENFLEGRVVAGYGSRQKRPSEIIQLFRAPIFFPLFSFLIFQNFWRKRWRRPDHDSAKYFCNQIKYVLNSFKPQVSPNPYTFFTRDDKNIAIFSENRRMVTHVSAHNFATYGVLSLILKFSQRFSHPTFTQNGYTAFL